MSDNPNTTPFQPTSAEAFTGPYTSDSVDAGAWPAEAGPYRIEGEVGHGGMGVVLRGHDAEFGRTLAVKVLAERHAGREDLERRFLEEAHLTGRLQHPGIAPVHVVGRLADGRPYFSMKLIEGKTLAALLKSREERGRLLKVFEQVCQTVAYAHSRGVIHRDLKPGNVMVGEFGEVQVLDWGLAKELASPLTPQPPLPLRGEGEQDRRLLSPPGGRGVGGEGEEEPLTPQPPLPLRGEGEQERAALLPPLPSVGEGGWGGEGGITAAGTVVGTFAYMPPEQARGESVDERADVFGLGAMLCEILTGKPAYVGEDLWAKARAADLSEALARLDRCSADAELVTLAKCCLAADREARSSDGGAVASAMGSYFASVDERARRAESERAAAMARAEEAKATVTAERRAKRVTLGLGAAVLLLLAAGGTVAWIVQRQKSVVLARQQEANSKANERIDRARSSCEVGWKTNDVGLLTASLVEADRAVDLAAEGDEPVRAEAEAVRHEIERKLEQAKKNRKLLTAILDITEPRETNSYRMGERGKVAVVALPSEDAQFASAFRAWGVEIDRVTPEAAATRLRAQPDAVVQETVAGIDQWALIRRRSNRPEAEWRRLIAVADRLDADTPRKEVRAILAGSPLVRDTANAATWDRGRLALKQLAAKVNASREPVLSLLVLAWALEAFEEGALAQRKLREAVAVHRGEAALLFALGKLHEREQPPNLGEAIECYRAACALRPQAGVSLAMALVDRKRYEEAEAVLRHLTGTDSHNPERYFYLGYVLRSGNKLRDAEAAYRKAIELRPDLVDALINLSNVLEEQKKLTESVAVIRKALVLRPNDAGAHNNLGNALASQRKLNEAIAAFRKGISLDAGQPELHTSLGIALAENQQIDEALVSLRKAVAIRPTFAPGHNNLGIILERQKQLPQAIAAYRKAIELQPDLPEPYNNLANALTKQKQFAEAVIACRKALELRPDYAEAYSTLGIVLAELKQLPQAVIAYRKAIELQPEYPEAHTNLGIALRTQGKLDESISAHRAAIKLRPDFAEPHHNLGIALAAQKQLEDAITSLRVAIRLRPEYPEAYNALGLALAEQNKGAEAIVAYRKAIELMPDNPVVHHNLGLALGERMQFAEAIPAFRQAVRLRPDYPEANYNLALALAREQRFEEAITACRKAIECRPNYAEAHHNLGVMLREKKKLPDALLSFRDAEKLLPENPAIRNQIRMTESWIEFDKKFADLLTGKQQLSTVQDQLAFAMFCREYKQHHRAAAQHFADAFDADSKLASGRHSIAARSAALAAAGKGEDASKLDDKERERLRRQARRWMSVSLAALSAAVAKKTAKDYTIRGILQTWKADADLASIRDKAALDKLPEADRAPFVKFWADVDALLAKVDKQK